MRSFALASALATLAAFALATPTLTDLEQPHKRASLPTVTASGNAFWQDKTRFYIRGIDYQPGGSSAMKDPLADSTTCLRDIAEFKKLGVNTIRVYITDNSANHDTCMNALADAGIYAIIDANNPLFSINRYDPVPSYNAMYLQSVFATVDEFIQYDNLLAFFSGNEVINDNVTSTLSARYVKATTRDMRQYIANRGYRKVPVGYSAADVSQNRMQMAQYMNCGTDDERSDFFAFNDYSWCNTNFQVSGWDQKVKNFTGYGLPIFLSEYGCTTNGRDFGEVAALMNSEMTGVYSGGLMYEYALEDNGFGIVKISSSGVQEQGDFAKFAKALSANPAPTGDGGFTSTTKSQPCPTKDANWLVDSTLLPEIPSGAKAFMNSGAGKGPGLTGDGSQNAGPASISDASPGSGAATATPTHSKNAAGITTVGAVDKAPLILTALVFVLTLSGTLLL
ncbi:beta-glucanosyltransferase gel1 [Lasiosphaeria miniovina]|uniref:1,3-beta-glucanosyltransferase n=1 Tax=Lasiosphaeria miniovina TaxID=1954250 RepID=A0AA40B6B4_9PEZI|nr:beta-glucanosyltransferase gel1 [Lasiosphaeria miniovina]KAK0728500.1 beta-glucanosyltransferase gel1 [Lasiosphaeria miniovina]